MKTLKKGFIFHGKEAVTLLIALVLCGFSLQAKTPQAQISIKTEPSGTTVNPNIYGHFAEHLGRCIYGGIWVGEDSKIPNTNGIRNDVVEALKQLEIPVLRWPGGCFADEYHWMDGIGPREKRPTMINTNWGGVVENNHFGTHEFMDLVEQLGCEAYINGNVGSGTPEEMMEWVEYLTSDSDSTLAKLRRANGRDKAWKVKYFGVGNESWGCGGSMRPEYYADLYRRYNTFVKNYQAQNPIFRIACGANGADYNWTEVLMSRVPSQMMNGLSLHYYTVPTGQWNSKGSSTDFDERLWFETLRQTMQMDEIIAIHSSIMDRSDPDKRVGLIVDEWGTWYDPLPGTNPGFLEQQNSLRDALVAGLNLHIFHNHADRVAMANIAQTVNVLQAMILTDGPEIVLTPSYWVFEMFKVHQGGQVLPLELKSGRYSFGENAIPSVSASATRDPESGLAHVSLINLNPNEAVEASCTLDKDVYSKVTGRILGADEMNALNTFQHPENIKPKPFMDARLFKNELKLTLPPKSVVVLELR